MNRVVRTAMTLAAVAALCAGIVAGTYSMTRERIAANERAYVEARLAPALGDLSYDTGLMASMLTLEPPHGLPGDEPAAIYRVYNQGGPAAALFAVTAMDGYAGPIRILVGIDANGTLTGVRIIDHDETPGLGDKIESSRTDWILQFDGRSLGDPPTAAWAIRADGGSFDQLTGATVTPRAVVKAVRDTLHYFEAERATLFDLPSRDAQE